jgi:hypothetical protein
MYVSIITPPHHFTLVIKQHNKNFSSFISNFLPYTTSLFSFTLSLFFLLLSNKKQIQDPFSSLFLMSMMKFLWIFWFLKTPSSVKISTLTHTLFFNPSHFPFHPLFLFTSFFNYKKLILWPHSRDEVLLFGFFTL